MYPERSGSVDVPRSVLEAGVRAYVDRLCPQDAGPVLRAECAALVQRIVDTPGSAIVAAIVAAVEADRSLPVTGGPGAQ